MRKMIFLFIVIAWSHCGICQSAISDSVSVKIARKMKDSLSLTSAQESRLLNINRYLSAQKQLVRSRYASVDSIQTQTQKIEAMRDSLYKKILADKYTLYKQKKRKLVNNN